jgi:DNA-directed RNA polymerase specialized sigma24 family protein
MEGGMTMEELLKYLKALVALQLRSERDETVAAPKIEIILAGLGFTAREISDLSGKSQAAVAKTISRAKASLKGVNSEESKETLNQIHEGT